MILIENVDDFLFNAHLLKTISEKFRSDSLHKVNNCYQARCPGGVTTIRYITAASIFKICFIELNEFLR